MLARQFAIPCAVLGMLVLQACAEDTSNHPEDDLAVRIGPTAITRAEVARTLVDEWPLSPRNGGKAVRPPRYTACVKTKSPANARALAHARRVCEEIYTAHESVVVGTMIQTVWARQAAAAEDLEPTPAEVDRIYSRRLSSFPPSALARFRRSRQARQRLRTAVHRQERIARLAPALNAAPETLSSALARRFRDRTRCAPRYRAMDVPECTGALVRP